MKLPVMPPVKPMLAKLVPEIPAGALYEPKFDGFRCVAFRDGDAVELGSRNERPMNRYFPDILEALKRELPPRVVLDGEIVLMADGRLDFEALQQRIHPAASRVNMLARETPASFIAFDLLALGDESFTDRPFSERRAALEEALKDAKPPVYVTPATSSLEEAREWFDRFEGAGVDGIIAKPPSITYVPDKRVMFKIKHERTADCVVAGFRPYKSGDGVGSLLLGLYEGDDLWPIGVAASFAASFRKQLVEELAPHRLAPGDWHPWAPEGVFERMPGEPSRWSQGKDQSWEPLRPERVVEVSYDYMEGKRFRHVAHFKRWRPDRDPKSCTYEQLEQPGDFDLRTVLEKKAPARKPKGR
ncbi:MAG: ATP-dependent DNA ligase [Actinomycetota bacterium]